MWAGQQYCRWQSLTSFGKTLWLPVAIVTWAAAVAIGWRLILDYEFKPESPNLAVATSWWPADTNLVTAPNRPTILFFVHPKCPCTRASLSELERIWVLREAMTISPPQLIVVATVPSNATSDWLTSRTLERANKLSDSKLVIDTEGREAQRFGAMTSGTVMWFDDVGRRLFAGGITAGRGHEGDNAGRKSIEDLLRGSTRLVVSMPALGCKLCLPEARSESSK